MRIASSNAYETSISNLQKRQAALTDSQERLTSGKRVLRASDDPAAAAVAERALAVQQRSDSQLRALNASRNAMALSESALGNAGEMVAQARDLLVSAGNGSYGDSERRAIADSIRGLRNDLLAVANRQDGAGRYLFGGLGSNTPPLVDAPGSCRRRLAVPRRCRSTAARPGSRPRTRPARAPPCRCSMPWTA
jgi:flagellar hook-associated protein 3 FlgL